MKKLFLCIPALAILAVACQKVVITPAREDGVEPAPVVVKMITETVSGSRGTTTKASIVDADLSFRWKAGDNIAVHVSNGTDGMYVFTSDTGASGASAAAETASFTVVYPDGFSRDAFAVYPSTIVAADAANYGQDSKSLDVTLPGSYTLAEVSGETFPGPMISFNEAGKNWDFFQLCGMLRLTVNSIPPGTKRLEINFNGKQVWGGFSIAHPSPGTSAIATDDDDTHDTITITNSGENLYSSWGNGKVFNIPLPVGEYANITITAYDALTGGNATLSLTRPFEYSASNQYGTKRTASLPTAFRGYEVSTGILERSKSGDAAATYSLTSGEMVISIDPVSWAESYSLPDGCNPFEAAVYYGQSASLNKYFNKWDVLREELGYDGNNIDAKSFKLPDGWQFPSGGSDDDESVWGTILFGAPKSPITVNGTAITSDAFAMVSVNLEDGNSYSVAAGTYYGMFLLRDGATIPKGYLTWTGSDSTYEDNPLDEEQFKDLIRLGCLFISASGFYWEGDETWRDLDNYYQCGHYWTNTIDEDNQVISFDFDETGDVSAATNNSGYVRDLMVVKLVKPLAN